ncbi:MAG: dockerin type I domain-containing protein, partial [Pirellulaceae bacterium]
VTSLAASAIGHATAHNTLDVINQETLTLSLGQVSLSEAAAPVNGTVTRTNADLSQALTVHLASSDTTGLIVPTTITLDAQQSSVTFPITPQDDTLLDGSQDVTVTASATGYPDVDALLTVTDHETLTVTLQNAVIVEQVSTTGTVTRSNTDNLQSLVVALAASDSSEVTLPASVTIAGGQASASFLVTAIDDGLDDATQITEIEAVAVGYISQAAQLQVVDHPFPWQNVSNALDVDGDGSAVPLDVLIIINNLNIEGARALPVPTTQFTPPPYYDASGDGFITALDALVVINYLNQQGAGEGEKAGSFGENWESRGRGPGAVQRATVESTGATASGDGFLEARDRFWRAFVQLAKPERADHQVDSDFITGWRPLEELLNPLLPLFF